MILLKTTEKEGKSGIVCNLFVLHVSHVVLLLFALPLLFVIWQHCKGMLISLMWQH